MSPPRVVEAGMRDQTRGPAGTPRDGRGRLLSVLLLVLPVPLCALILATESPPIETWGRVGIEGFTYRTDYNHALMGALATVTAVGALVLAWGGGARARLRRGIRHLITIAALVLILFGALLYFYGSRVGRLHYPWFHDSYHYVLGPKYFSALGYDRLYGCHLQADAQRPERRYADSDRVTDLTRDRAAFAGEVRARTDCSEFSPERWAEFQGDVSFYDQVVRKDVLRDRGYNGTPFHTVVSGAIANRVNIDYETVLGLTFIDIVAICVMLAAVSWAFGWRIGCLFALFVFTNFADRFNFIGASFFRYVWLACLVTGLSMMKRLRYGPAALLIVAAAMLNVFPLLFLIGIPIKIAFEAWEHRRIATRHRSFVTWAVVGGLALGALSLAQKNPVDSYRLFFDAMQRHSREATPMRVGFRYDFSLTDEAARSGVGTGGEEQPDDTERPPLLYYVLGGAALLIGVWVARRLDDVSATVLVGFLSFFVLFGTATYYYAVTALLLLSWHRPEDRRSGLVFASILFGLTGGIYLLWYLTDNDLRFLNNTAMSWALTLVLGGLLLQYARSGSRAPSD